MLHHLGKLFQTLHCGYGHVQVVFHRTARHRQHTATVGYGTLRHFAHRHIAYTARRQVNHPLERLVIQRIGTETEIRQGILDFLALVERRPAVNTVGYTVLAQLILEDTRLGISPIKNSHVVKMFLVLLDNDFRYSRRFVAVATIRSELHRFSYRFLGKDLLIDLVLIMMNEAVSRLDDGLRRAVVLLQLEEFGVRIPLPESEDVTDIRSTERVDGLGIIAHYAYLILRLCEHLHNHILRVVGILVFVHQDILEDTLIVVQDIRIGLEQQAYIFEQVVKIHCVGGFQPCVIETIQFRHFVEPVKAVAFGQSAVACIRLVRNQGVLGSRYA